MLSDCLFCQVTLREFYEAWEIFPPDVAVRGSGRMARSPLLIGLDESQSAIPWRVGLHQSPPPLYRLI